MVTIVDLNLGYTTDKAEMHSRGADRFKLPLTDVQRDEILVALAIKHGILQKPLTLEESVKPE